MCLFLCVVCMYIVCVRAGNYAHMCAGVYMIVQVCTYIHVRAQARNMSCGHACTLR